MADTDHWSSTPRLCCAAIISALETNMGGLCPSICRVASDTDLELIGNGLHSGLPGVLLYYGGGTLSTLSTHQQNHGQEMAYRLLCCSGAFDSLDGRQSGTGQMDIDAATAPGVEELQDWAYRFAARALADVTGVCRVRVERMNPATFIRQGLYIGTVDLIAMRELNIYDAEGENTLEALGIVTNPTDSTAIWSDPPTDTVPDSDWPGDLGGGAEYTLEDL